MSLLAEAQQYSSPTRIELIRNKIVNNFGDSGGGINIGGGHIETISLIGNTISGNYGSLGGGVRIGITSGTINLVNNVTSNNRSNPLTPGGGIRFLIDGPITTNLTNNTITGNTGNGVYFRISHNSAVANVSNNIIWSNSNGLGAELYIDNDPDFDFIAEGVVNLFNNDFDHRNPEGIYMQVGFPVDPSNLNNLAPLFVDPVNGDFHLQAASPCINVGSNSAPGLPDTDKDGLPRIANGIVDIGAYEYQGQLPNQPPIAKCQDVSVSAGSGCSAPASIDNGSYDPDGDSITLTQSPPGPYPLGSTPVTLTVDDSRGALSQCTGTVTVIDNTPPIITSVLVDPSVLWPPNHKMEPVSMVVQTSDTCDPNPVCEIVSINSNEPDNGLGDGDTSPDWEITGDFKIALRAERSGAGSGRLYTITVECGDAVGNASQSTIGVTVPYDR